MRARLAEIWGRWKAYWTATGVIARWQLVVVYTFITAVFAVTATWSLNAADEAQQAVEAVQQQRTESILTACEAQNQRHNTVVSAINQQIIIAIVENDDNRSVRQRATDLDRLKELAEEAAKADTTQDHERLQEMADEAKRLLAPQDQTRFDRAYAQTFALLNAGAPKQDCEALANRAAPPIETNGDE